MNPLRLRAPQVQVVLGGCPAADAEALFAALQERLGSDRGADDVPHETAGNRPTMWTGTFDVSSDSASPGSTAHSPPRLSGPLTADVQGSPSAVERLHEILKDMVTVHELGTASGDQEVEVQWRLESRTES